MADAEVDLEAGPEAAAASGRLGAVVSETEESSDQSHAGDVARKAKRGFSWSIAGQIVGKVGGFALNLVLARLLLPADFGLFAIALSVVTFLMMVNDVGIIAASMQWQGKFEDIVPTASIMAFVSSALFFGAALIGAPLLAEWAGNPGATPLIRLISAAIVVDGVIAVRTASLLRNFKQQKLVIAHLIAVVVQMCVAIPLALTGFGAGAMSAAYVASFLSMGVAIFWFAKLPFSLSFDLRIAKKLMRFGMPLAVALGTDAVIMNIDYFVVGHILGATAVGLYLLAFNISSWVPGVVLGALRWVAIPGFSQLNSDPEALAKGVQRSLTYLVIVIMPVSIVMIVLAPSLVIVLYGEVWAPAVEAMRWLVLLGVIRLAVSLIGEVLISAGRTLTMLWVAVAWLAVLVPALIYGTEVGGIRGTGIAHVVVAVVVALPLALIVIRRRGVRLLPIVRALARPFAAGCVCALVCVYVAKVLVFSMPLQLVLAGAAAMVAYVLVASPPDRLKAWTSKGIRIIASRVGLG